MQKLKKDCENTKKNATDAIWATFQTVFRDCVKITTEKSKQIS